MTTIKFPVQYMNGNVHVRLDSDGTKIRWYEGEPKPVLPESIDLKITNWCDGGCSYCHENSTVRGQHAPVERIAAITDGMIPGSEIAIGGGDPFSHPELEKILVLLNLKGLVANVTVNDQHIHQHRKEIQRLRGLGLIHGLGISCTFGASGNLRAIADENTVLHFIVGKDDPQEVISYLEDGYKVLILGYKQYGRGVNIASDWLASAIDWWKYWLSPMMNAGWHMAFDNLAIEQLGVLDRLVPKQVEQFYMGGDGEFTMYVDAVTDSFAKNSTLERIPRRGRTIEEMFSAVKEL